MTGRVRTSDEALTLLAHWLRSVLVDVERTLLDRMNEVVGHDEVDEVLRHARPLSSPDGYSQADFARLIAPASTPSCASSDPRTACVTADLGDGLRARVGELERRIAVAMELCDNDDASADRHGFERLDVVSSIRFALRGDQ